MAQDSMGGDLICRAPLEGDLRLLPSGEAEAVAAEFVPGRRGPALRSRKGGQPAARLRLDRLPREQGTLMAWYRPEAPAPTTVEEGVQTQDILVPVEGDGPGLRLQQASHSAWFTGLDPGNAQSRGLQEVFSHVVPGKWYHLAYTWDRAAHDICLYVFGEPQVDAAFRALEESAGPMDSVYALGNALGSVQDVRLYGRALRQEEIVAAAEMGPTECFYTEGRQDYDCLLEVEHRKGELVLAEDFDPGWEERWVLEGPGVLTPTAEGLRMQEDGGHIVLWNRQVLPADFIAEWDFTRQVIGGLCIVFFCATGRQGESLFDPALPPRDGNFMHYILGEMNCYHISYARGAGRRAPNTALRKNYGFYRVAGGQDFMPLQAGVTSHLTLVKRHAHLQFAINGRVSLDWVDDGMSRGRVWGEGGLGLRQMVGADAVYGKLRVWRLKP